ncbi:hypothetical protein D3C80_1526800 [compost metagenome]
MSPLMLPVVPPLPTCSTPPSMVVPPAWDASPVRMSVPESFLISRPTPWIGPASVRFVPVLLNAPSPWSTTSRPMVMVVVVLSVPPLKLSPPAAEPRLVSLKICNTPPLIAVPPV